MDDRKGSRGRLTEALGGLRGWILALCAAHFVLGLLLWEPVLFSGGDNAGYMILGESLRTGAGYLDLYLPDAPVHAKYPPLYPAILGLLGWIGGLQLFKLASLGFTTAAVALAASLGTAPPAAAGRAGSAEAGRAERHAPETAPRGPALLAAGVLAISPVLLEHSHLVLSEAPFLFFVLLGLWALESGRDRWGLALGAGAAAFLTRTAGLPLLVALILYAALRGEKRRVLAAVFVAAAAAGGWALFQRLGAPAQPGYLQELVMIDPYDPSAGTVGAAGLVERAASNLWLYASHVLPASLAGGGEGPAASGGAGALRLSLGLVATGLALAGWLRRMTRRIGGGELFTLLYLGLISVWPSVWTGERFLLPVLPFLLLYAVEGAGLMGRGATGVGGGGRRIAVLLVAAVLALPAALHGVRTVPERLECMAGYRAGQPCTAPAVERFYEMARWSRDGTPADAVIVNRKPRLFYWISGRRGDVYPYTSRPEILLQELAEIGAEYVVVDNLSATTPRYLIPAIQASPGRFEVVHQTAAPATWLFRFLPSPGTALGPPASPR